MITAFSNPKDVVAVAITDFADPLLHMAPSLPTHSSVRRKQGLHPEKPTANESAEETAEREEHNEEHADTVRELQKAEMKIFADRQKVVVNNLLWGIVMGQCTPALQEELRAEDTYESRAAD